VKEDDVEGFNYILVCPFRKGLVHQQKPECHQKSGSCYTVYKGHASSLQIPPALALFNQSRPFPVTLMCLQSLIDTDCTTSPLVFVNVLIFSHNSNSPYVVYASTLRIDVAQKREADLSRSTVLPALTLIRQRQRRNASLVR
jgi:hypothetical protein